MLFAVALHCAAYNLFTDHQTDGEEDTLTYVIDSQKVSSAQLPYLPEGELSTGVQFHQINISRIQRIHLLEYATSLKTLIHLQSLREAALVQHQGRINDTTTSYNCHPASEYYVFALRHIII